MLLETCGPGLHALLRRITLCGEAAEELLQELFLNLSRSNGFVSADDPAGYAFRAAINLAFAWRRRQSPGASPLESEPTTPPTADPLAILIADEQVQQLLAAIDQLPSLQRDVIVLRFIQQESYECIGARVHRSPRQLRAVCHKAMVSLRKLLAAQ